MQIIHKCCFSFKTLTYTLTSKGPQFKSFHFFSLTNLSNCNEILIYKLEHNYGIKGNLLAWAGDYLSKRKQYTVVNGELSDQADVTSGVPQGSVLGPTLFALCTGGLPDAVSCASLYMYADDTTMHRLYR